MDILSSIIYIVLFILLMIFVFSMGLLTPMVEKKDILSVVAMGFIVGIVGGGFLIAPIYDELPSIAGTLQQIIGEDETVSIELSTNTNVNNFIKEIEAIEGVRSVENEGLLLETSNFSNERKKIIEEKIPIVNENFKSWHVDPVGRIYINITEGFDANNAVKILSDWLIFSADIKTKYSIIKIKINVGPYELDNLLSYLQSKEIVISSLEGPVQKAIEDTKNNMLDRNFIIFFMGIFGVLVALFGSFYDDTILYLKERLEIIQTKIIEIKKEIKNRLSI